MSISSLQPNEMQFGDLKRTAARLLNVDVVSIKAIGGGRNSRVYRIEDADSRSFALKVYFRHHADGRDRLGTEYSSLRFLWENGERDIPQPIAVDREQSLAVYEYIDGHRLLPAQITEEDIEAAVQFLARLRKFKHRAGSRGLAPASEACFSGGAIVMILQRRLSRLLAHLGNSTTNPVLHAFLTDEFLPACGAIIRWSRSRFSRDGVLFDQELELRARTLSPSDFGFHNALRRTSRQIAFLDFEYFGWDDPAKMVVDFLLHPAMELSESLKRKFAAGILYHFTDYPGLSWRIESVYPLFGLKWCLILLNEFLPEDLLRRQFAGANDRNLHDLQREQLLKARQMLCRINGEYEHFPYFG